MLDLSAIEFVRLLASEDSAEKEVVRVKFICSKKDKFTSQPKRACGHRCGSVAPFRNCLMGKW
jgi:hypothetical protein